MKIGLFLVLVFFASLASCQNYFEIQHHKTLEDFFQPGKERELARAAAIGDIQAVERLLVAGANPNTLGRDGVTPLGWAVGAQVQIGSKWSLNDSSLNGVRALLRGGANPNVSFLEGVSPLSLAVLLDSVPLLEILLSNGASPDFEGVGNSTALSRAAVYSTPAIVKLLIEHGANPNYYSEESSILLDSIYADAFDNATILLEANANPRNTAYTAEAIGKYMTSVYSENLRNKDFTKCVEMLRKQGVKIAGK